MTFAKFQVSHPSAHLTAQFCNLYRTKSKFTFWVTIVPFAGKNLSYNLQFTSGENDIYDMRYDIVISPQGQIRNKDPLRGSLLMYCVSCLGPYSNDFCIRWLKGDIQKAEKY